MNKKFHWRSSLIPLAYVEGQVCWQHVNSPPVGREVSMLTWGSAKPLEVTGRYNDNGSPQPRHTK
jgi:hypothetical protein